MPKRPNNAYRAQWARKALDVFATEAWGIGNPSTLDPADVEAALTDLIADLLHLATREGFDASAVLDTGRLHFNAELEGEE